MLEVLNHVGSFKTGDTRPQVFTCRNGDRRERWVMKLGGVAPAELAADWIGCALALRLGIPTPLVEIANVSIEALSTAPDDVRAWARPGPAFASQEVHRSNGGIFDDTIAKLETEGPSNADFLGALYALDCWLEVLDRRKPDGSWNLLHDLDTNSLCAIDFGKSLTPCFGLVLGADPTPILPNYPSSIRRIASRAHALSVCAMIEGLNTNEVTTFVTSVPSAWIESSTRSRILEFLSGRAHLIRPACERLGEGSE